MRITVVIPVLDDAEMLDRCLESLAAQDRVPDEVLVVDNGSRDDSVQVALDWCARVVSEPRPGVTAAAATGFDLATGEVIARCDADSVLPPGWLARIEDRLSQDPEAVAVSGPASFHELSGFRDILARRVYIDAWFAFMRVLLGNNVVFGSNCAVRRSVWRAVSDSVPRDDPAIHDDIDLSFRFPPGARVLHDRSLVAGISARPFDRSMGRRLTRAFHTFGLHWPAQNPVSRWSRRLVTRPVTGRPVWV